MTLFRAFVFSVATLLAAQACSDSAGPSSTPEPAMLAINGRHLCRTSDAGAACWGQGTLGQLGDGAASSAATPVEVAGAAAFKSIVAGYTHTCALDTDGAAWCWGSNLGGELGTGTLPDEVCGGLPCQTRPIKVATTEHFTELAAGNGFTCGLAARGSVLCWGYNDKGQLGTTTDTGSCGGIRCSRTPIASGRSEDAYRRITAGQSHICGLNDKGEAWCWGYDGHTVDGAHVHMFSPVPALNSDSLAFSSISSGGYHTCALRSNGEAWCWGLDAVGAGPDILEADHPVPVVGAHRFQAIRAGQITTCGLEKDGRIFCWGANSTGSVGREPVGSTVLFNSPQEISGNLRFTALSGGGSTFCGVTTSGSLACWGRGTEGQLLNGAEDSSMPVILGFGP
jgi:alpha-tubulin suppressor-like RCC1 family protein